jgi:hypothetical protein
MIPVPVSKHSLRALGAPCVINRHVVSPLSFTSMSWSENRKMPLFRYSRVRSIAWSSDREGLR